MRASPKGLSGSWEVVDKIAADTETSLAAVGSIKSFLYMKFGARPPLARLGLRVGNFSGLRQGCPISPVRSYFTTAVL